MAGLRETLIAELDKYTGEGAGCIALPVYDEEHHHYAVTIMDYPERENPMALILMARIINDKIVIEEDMTDKKLIDALLQQGVRRDQIILAYAGEKVTEAVATE